MAEATTYTNAQKLAEIEREIITRKRVYPRWVAGGRMAQADADHRLDVLKAIAKDYAPEPTPDLFGGGQP